MNSAWEKLVSCDKDVTNIMKWWLVEKSPKKYLRMAMRVGGVMEVVQQTCLNIVNRRVPVLTCHWTTAAINQTRWTLLAMAKKQIYREYCHAAYLDGIKHDLATPDIQVSLAMQNELSDRVPICLKSLSYRERVIVEMRMQEMTLEEIGFCLKVTGARIRQIEEKAILKLRMPNVARNVVAFLD